MIIEAHLVVNDLIEWAKLQTKLRAKAQIKVTFAHLWGGHLQGCSMNNSNELQLFTFDTHKIRYTEIDGINYASAVDCCRALGYKNPDSDWANLKRRNPELLDYTRSCKLQAFDDRLRGTDCLNNQGAIILSMLSKTDIGRRFRKIASKFLIEQMDRVPMPTDPDQQALMLAESIIRKNAQIKQLESDVDLGRLTIQEFEPKANYYDKTTAIMCYMRLSAWWLLVGGAIQYPEGWTKTFYANGWLKPSTIGNRTRYIPSTRLVKLGYLDIKYDGIPAGPYKGEQSPTVYITKKGGLYFFEKLGLMEIQPDLFGGE